MAKVILNERHLSVGTYEQDGSLKGYVLETGFPESFTTFRRGACTFRTNLVYDGSLRCDLEGKWIAFSFYGPLDVKMYAIAEWSADAVDYDVKCVLSFYTQKEHAIVAELRKWVASINATFYALDGVEKAKAMVAQFNSAFPNVNVLSFHDDVISIALPRRGFDYKSWKGRINIGRGYHDFKLNLSERISEYDWDQCDIFSIYEDLDFDCAKEFVDGFVKLVEGTTC